MICRITPLLPLAALLAASSSSFLLEIASGFAVRPPSLLATTRRSASPPRGLLAASSFSRDDDDDDAHPSLADFVVEAHNDVDDHDHDDGRRRRRRAADAPTSNAAVAVAYAAAASFLLLTSSASPAHAAAGPDWGIFEGRTGSLLHPIAMISMFGLSASTALLGFQWKRQRTIGDEISSLKRTMPDLRGSSSAREALSAVTSAAAAADPSADDESYARSLRDALETEAKIEELTRERKELANSGPRDRHFNQGALLLFVGTAFAIEGPLNTYARAGKLFPGPHLYAGAGLVVLWSLAASMVPYMQKGNDAARAVHIGANLAGIGLFAWQVTTGLPILFKVIELTKWP